MNMPKKKPRTSHFGKLGHLKTATCFGKQNWAKADQAGTSNAAP